jgi:hypothetical protein
MTTVVLVALAGLSGSGVLVAVVGPQAGWVLFSFIVVSSVKWSDSFLVRISFVLEVHVTVTDGLICSTLV